MERIRTQEQLQSLAERLGVTLEWHEPDNQGVTVRLEGQSFDNAGTWPAQPGLNPEATEMYLVISQKGRDMAMVNLANLLSWGSFPDFWQQRSQRERGIWPSAAPR